MNISAPEILEPGFVLSCAAVVFLMQAGFCLLESGMVRAKNSINVAVKNVLDCSITMLLFVSCGFSKMYGASFFGVIGDPFSTLDLSDPKMVSFLLFQLVFCETRCRGKAMLLKWKGDLVFALLDGGGQLGFASAQIFLDSISLRPI